MKTNFIKLATFLTLVTSFAIAQEQDSTKTIEEVVISDTKFAQSKEKSGKIIDIVSAKDLEARKGQSAAQILNQVAGIEINGSNSSAGKNLEYYIRGGRSRQVLILIDGIPVNDASSITTVYDLRLLPVEQIEQIEILKGSSSVLYGSGAATSVINITTKKAKKDGITGNAYFNIGTQNTTEKTNLYGQELNQGFGINGSSGKFNFNTSLNSTEANGISEAQGVNFERDKFSRISLNQKIGYKFSNKFNLEAFANYDKFISNYDLAAFKDSDLNKYASEQLRFGIKPQYKYKKGEIYLNAAFANLERNYESFNTWTLTLDESYYKSRTVNADLVNKLDLAKQVYLITGVQSQFMDYYQSGAWGEVNNKITKFSIVDPYVTAVYNSSFGLNVNTGARLNMHSQYGNNVVYNINPSFNIQKINLRILSSYSTAYITPSLYQLYSAYGNLDLKPEEDKTAEFGFEKAFLNKKIILNAVGFYREEKNKIDFINLSLPPWGQYRNIVDKINAKGVEVNFTYLPVDKIKLSTNYTFTQVENSFTFLQLIPKHKFNAGVDYQITKRLNCSAQYQYTDHKADLIYNPSRTEVELKSFQTLNSNISFKVDKYLSLFAGVTNLFDVDFVEKAGYSTRGRNFKVGLNFNF
ncbi:TonB-dependent receptor [Flavobacterium sp. F372]|jgi:vitamin B12 transporter|uniref:TonB-dependent receptor n=1 Tax=Flavobacterium bernardetii TaxID=2813823 RepID=A0ABR7IUT0_9FLAO|nr:TonB-dependent receptor [Flavobacterium bernardetii]MBC5833483.1 TonB-dependent receptor [Flavobacterium bernardetii]NHF68715.1 TonB-dependent receptor [Flavobacterium bernardetii]